MAYFVASYYTNYFDIGEAVAEAVVRAGGGLAPSLEEWQEYLRRWHELRRQEAAEFAARKGVRAYLREQMFPAPKTVTEVVTRAVAKAEAAERAETRIVLRRIENQDIRLEVAKLMLDLRKRAHELNRKRKKQRKRKRDEEALLTLWLG